MSGKPSPQTLWAMKLIKEHGMTAHAAALKVGIAVSTIYRAPAYRAMKQLLKRNVNSEK